MTGAIVIVRDLQAFDSIGISISMTRYHYHYQVSVEEKDRGLYLVWPAYGIQVGVT